MKYVIEKILVKDFEHRFLSGLWYKVRPKNKLLFLLKENLYMNQEFKDLNEAKLYKKMKEENGKERLVKIIKTIE